MTAVTDRGAISAPASERQHLAKLGRLLEQDGEAAARLMGPDGELLPLPESARTLMCRVVHLLAEGRAVAIVALEQELTTQEAADLLNVSRPYLVRLLDRGDIPSTRTGTHRRVRFEDLMAYKRRRDAERRAGLRELTQLSQALGNYGPPRAAEDR